MTKRMVFGDDGSVGADVAWLWVNSHAWPGWRVEVLHAAVPDFVRVGGPHPEPHPWHPAQARTAFPSTLAEVDELIIEQDPRLALSRPADLVVIGPRGAGALKALHLGSTAEWLMSRPPAPLVIARHGRQTHSVLACVDGSPSSDRALAALLDMPWIGHTEVHVVSVADGRVAAHAAVERAAADVTAAGARVIRHVLEGDPTDELLGYARYVGFDLVVLGTRGLTGMKRWVTGSTAAALSRSLDASILLAFAEPGSPESEAATP